MTLPPWRGKYVDDRRYGRVLISWDAFERVDFCSSSSGPAYGDFPPGRPLNAARLAGGSSSALEIPPGPRGRATLKL